MFSFLTNPTFLNNAIVWLGALCTIGIYSVLYRENRFFRFFEHLFIGLATGYTIYSTWNDVLKPRWWEPMTKEGQWWWAFALPAGLLFFFVYSKRYNWMSRLVFGVFFGMAAGQAFQGYAAYYFPLIRSAIDVPLRAPDSIRAAEGAYALSPLSFVLNNILYLVIIVAVMSYFFFSFELKNRTVAGVSKFGRYVLMFAFGSIFGSTIMARMSLLIGRMYFLLHNWLHLAS